MGLASVLGRGALDEHQREIVALIGASSQTIERLLRDILDIARIEAGKLTLELAPFDLRGAVYVAAELAQVQAVEKGIGCFVEFTASAQGSFLGDEFRIRQLLLNLAANAVKFTPHGEVRILVDVREAADGGAAEVVFVVKDTGIGFPAEDAARLFQSFEQADALIARTYGGAGLGLAICKALTDAMGGAIHAQSEPGLGSSFTIVLPLARVRTPASLVAPQSLPASAPLRVLVAEDHPNNCRVIELILESANAEIVFASNGVEAVHARRGGEFHLILMDVLMPVMDGVTAVRAIRAFEAATGADRTPIAMLSANARDDQRMLALSAGADHFIAKPLTAAALLDGVAYAMEAGQRKAAV